jgi:uncharacterized protein
MRNGTLILDADAHVPDFDDVYRKWLPEQYRNRRGFFPFDGFDRLQGGKLDKYPKSKEQHISDNDQEGIDVQVLYPTRSLNFSRVREKEYGIAVAQSYNNFLADWCSVNPKRLKGIALVPLHLDVRAAIDEMSRAVGKLGMVGVMVNTYERDRNVAHESFWPFYEECAKQGVPVSFHASGSNNMAFMTHFDAFLHVHTYSHIPEQMIACTAIAYSGILEKYKNLRCAFLEAGCGWVPFWLERLEEEWEKRPFDAPLLKGKPSEYLRSGNVFFSCEADEKQLKYVIQEYPAENILFASDYPHWDCAFPHSIEEFMGRDDITADTKKKIICDSFQKFYNLKVNASEFT